MNTKLEEFINNLTMKEKDDLYRLLWAEYVKSDVESYCEELGLDLTEEEIGDIVERYVYNGDYDCNLCYWDNIENLINEVMICK